MTHIVIMIAIIIAWVCVLRLAYNLGRAMYRDTHRSRYWQVRYDELEHAYDLARERHLDTYRELIRLRTKP